MSKNNGVIFNYIESPQKRKWEMTDKEILRSWRCAKSHTSQVRVIAQLNARSIRETVEKLKSLGIDMDWYTGDRYGKYCGNYPAWTKKETEELVRLRERGMRFKEIGIVLKRSEAACELKYRRMCWGANKKPCKE